MVADFGFWPSDCYPCRALFAAWVSVQQKHRVSNRFWLRQPAKQAAGREAGSDTHRRKEIMYVI